MASAVKTPYGVVGAVKDLEKVLMDKDPSSLKRAFGACVAVYAEPTPASPRAIAGVECALLDIKAKALGISVAELFGGLLRDRVRVY